MRLKIFTTRLDEKYLQSDQAEINLFMREVNVKKTSTQFVPGDPDFWSILIFYELLEETQEKAAGDNPSEIAPSQETTTDQVEENENTKQPEYHGTVKPPKPAKEPKPAKPAKEPKPPAPEKKAKENPAPAPSNPTLEDLTEEDKQVYEALNRWRKDVATAAFIPDFMVMHSKQLRTIAANRPDHVAIKAILTPAQIEKYGDDILAIVNAF